MSRLRSAQSVASPQAKGREDGLRNEVEPPNAPKPNRAFHEEGRGFFVEPLVETKPKRFSMVLQEPKPQTQKNRCRTG